MDDFDVIDPFDSWIDLFSRVERRCLFERDEALFEKDCRRIWLFYSFYFSFD